MSLLLYGHPFSSYTQKALIALYENDTLFEFRMLGPDHERNALEHAKYWPLKRFPVLVDDGEVVVEVSIIIEYLDLHHRGPIPMLPENRDAALEARMLDRFFDNSVMTPMQRIVGNQLRPAEHRDPYGVDEARAALETAYDWVDERMQQHEWSVGDRFSLADCAAAPALFYADWVHPIPERLANARAYRKRLLARPSMARAIDEARPYRPLFPLGAPDRD
jgi:glutathione S-transferase